MFTGLVEEIGYIKAMKKGSNSIRLMVAANKIMDDVKLGDSIATNGICLTVVDFDSKSFSADVMPETMNRSSFHKQKEGSRVNLERALRVGDRMGGHMVSGHIDGVGEIISQTKDDNAIWVSISAPKNILKYVIEKGSIAIDGISLTVAYVDENQFKVSIIPLTQDDTTLISKKIGSQVNLECDMTAKYIEKFMFHKDDEKKESNISMDFLKENGFF
ncbi:riboflavin synthase [Ancylomarina euxinus]|uniref:Riboflavin synthase n=1 Tax=Ancylomarina euxinus TaxID=2283627 RepID=A0A425Y3H8_9BACT|nr:riboflavin synthase [Ancylomarina euxinus]MCZ4693222.1 riboflavin synthase [Ancylomarina euxinus]MUP15358.1 riboflavin synthase [Ancylomarina euxinus]RRG22516.1 riboflavin synthase [Ancylomarina euxinus]